MKNRIRVDKVGKQEKLSWRTKILRSEEERFFFVKSTRTEGVYKVDVVMMGSQEDCEDYMVEASILNVDTEMPVFLSSFHPRPPTDQNESIFCLSVPERGLSKAWKYDKVGRKYLILFSIRIVKLD